MKFPPIQFAAAAFWVLELVFSSGCKKASPPPPKISFTKIPDFGPGNGSQLDPIEGIVQGGEPGQKIVLYAKSGDWWVQPLADTPLTTVQKDLSWKNRTHPGSDYAALLVRPGFIPWVKTPELPGVGGPVLAIAKAQQQQSVDSPLGKTLLFAGYEWEVRGTENEAGGTRNFYQGDNVWLDAAGLLHLRIAGTPAHWTSGSVALRRSLGYGTYRMVVRDLSQLPLAAVFTMSMWGSENPDHEMDFEISKWGETFTRNAQFVIQPYHVPANTVQFQLPAGETSFMLRWVAGRATFKAFQGASAKWDQPSIREHIFTSEVPIQGDQSIHLNLYVFDNRTNPLQRGTEVVVEAFDYLP
jgi:hypothetical protein